MSDERFDRIERWQSRVDDWQAQADERFDRSEHWQAGANDRFEQIDRRFERVEQRLDGLTAEVREVNHNMRLLHEELVWRLKALPEQVVPTRSEMLQGFADIREEFGRRLDPLGAAVRQHSVDIDELKRRKPRGGNRERAR